MSYSNPNPNRVSKARRTRQRRLGKLAGDEQFFTEHTTRGPLTISRFNPFPAERDMEMTYCDNYVLYADTTPLANIFGNEQRFSLNSLYDPDYTGGGHQPYLYDQIAPMYGQNLVLCCDITLVFHSPSVAGMVVAATMNGSTQAVTTITGQYAFTANERSNQTLRMIPDTGNQRVVIRQSVNLWELEGVPYAAYSSNDGYRVTTGNNPSKVLFMAVACANTNSATASVKCLATIKYRVRWYSRLLPASS